MIRPCSNAGLEAIRAQPVLRWRDLRPEGRRQLDRLARLGLPLRQEQEE